jgi:hypothetical protein
MVVKIPKKLEMKSLLPAPRSPLPAHVLAFPNNILQEERLLRLVDPDLVSGALSSIAGALSSARLAQLNIVAGLMTSSAKTLRAAPQIPLVATTIT